MKKIVNAVLRRWNKHVGVKLSRQGFYVRVWPPGNESCTQIEVSLDLPTREANFRVVW